MLGRNCRLASVCGLPTILIIVATVGSAWGQVAPERTLGIISRDVRASEGYTLFKPLGAAPGGSVYLVNNAGHLVHQWTKPLATRPGGEVFLRKNGQLVLTTDEGIYALNPDSSLAWVIDSRDLGDGRWYGHHECVELPNGNMLVPGFIEIPRAEAEAAGFDVGAADACLNPNTGAPLPDLDVLRVDNIWELAPVDRDCGFACGWKVVWRWNAWDHKTNDPHQPQKAYLGYDDPAGGICSQFIQGAWTFVRFNALSYIADRDHIIMSASLFNEIWVIDHGKSTEQAAGRAGDLHYRWGNPYAYGAGEPFVDANNRGDQVLSFQHRVLWLPPGVPGAGNILIFNNGTDWGDSSVMEVKLPSYGGCCHCKSGHGEHFKPATIVWQYDEYDTPGSFFAPFISSVQRLPNGNTLINDGPAGYFFEVTPQGDKVWEYVNPGVGEEQGGAAAGVYRAWRYDPWFPGLGELDLVIEGPLEQYPQSYVVDIKPRSKKNRLNLKYTKGLRVAIPGSADLDVTQIDPASVLLEGFGATKWVIKDVTTPGGRGPDGYPDLVLKWRRKVVKEALADFAPGESHLLRLSGYSSEGWFLGSDEVFIKKSQQPNCCLCAKWSFVRLLFEEGRSFKRPMAVYMGPDKSPLWYPEMEQPPKIVLWRWLVILYGRRERCTFRVPWHRVRCRPAPVPKEDKDEDVSDMC